MSFSTSRTRFLSWNKFFEAGFPRGTSSRNGQQGNITGFYFKKTKNGAWFYIIEWRSNKKKRTALWWHFWNYGNTFGIIRGVRCIIKFSRSYKFESLVDLVIDSMFVCNTMPNSNDYQDRSIRRDVSDLIILFETRKINSVRWVMGAMNPADALTKRGCVHTQNIVKHISEHGSIPEALFKQSEPNYKRWPSH